MTLGLVCVGVCLGKGLIVKMDLRGIGAVCAVVATLTAQGAAETVKERTAFLQLALPTMVETGAQSADPFDHLSVSKLPLTEHAADVVTETLMRQGAASVVKGAADHGGVAAARAARQMYLRTSFGLTAGPDGQGFALMLGGEEIPVDQATARLSALIAGFDPQHRRIGLATLRDPGNLVPSLVDGLSAALTPVGFDLWVLIVSDGQACDFDVDAVLLALMSGIADRAPFGDGDGQTTLAEARGLIETTVPRGLRRRADCDAAYALILPDAEVSEDGVIATHDTKLSFRDLDSAFLVESFDAAYLAQAETGDEIESYLSNCRFCPDASPLEARLADMTRRAQLTEAEDAIWMRVSQSRDPAGLELYSALCSLCSHDAEARALLSDIRAEAAARAAERTAFEALQGSDDVAGLRAYLDACVYCEDKPAVEAALAEIADQAAYREEVAALEALLGSYDPAPLQSWLDTCRWCDGRAQAQAAVDHLAQRGTVAGPCVQAAGLPQSGGPRLLANIDIAKAAVACEAALAAYPTDPEFQMLRGRVYHAQGAIDAAKLGYDAGVAAGVPAAFGLSGYLLFEPPAGSDLVQDFEAAAKLAEQGVAEGDWLSRQLLSALYSQSLVEGKTPRDAVALARAGAEEGDPVSQFFAGYFLLKGLGHDAPDARAAQAWLSRAKDQGYLPANAFLAEALEAQPGLDADQAGRAVDLLLAGVKGGDPVAKAKVTTGLRDRTRPVVRALQTALRDAGVYRGRIDGVPGPGTVRAVEALVALQTQEEG